MTEELASALEKWIIERGYPLETNTARTLAAAGFFVSRGNLYIDPKTGQTREIDVLASRFSFADRVTSMRDLSIQVSVVVECKYVKDKSWVLFSQPAPSGPGLEVLDFLTNRLGRLFLIHLSQELHPPTLRTLSKIERLGYDLRAGPTKKDDEPDQAHAAYAQVITAARARASAYSDAAGPGHADIVIPVIVLDGPLFECVPGPEQRPALNPIVRGVLRTQSWDSNIPNTLVHIVTVEALAEFSHLCYEDARMLLDNEGSLSDARNDLRGR